MATKYLQLLDRLIKKTEAGELKWEEAAASNAFQVSFPNYAVILSEAEGESDTVDYIVELVNSDGRVIDRFSDVTLEGTDPSARNAPGHFNRMKSLFEVARRQALGVEQALDEILRQLEEEQY
jgi:hypothetical protein